MNNKISEKKQIERFLRESEERYRTLFEISPNAVGMLDANLNIVMVNRQVLKLYGCVREEEVIGRNIVTLFAPDELPQLRENLKELFVKGIIKDVQRMMIKSSGVCFPAEISCSLVGNPVGRPRSFIFVMKDITERRQAEEELKQHREHLEELVKERTSEISKLNENLVGLAEEALQASRAKTDFIANMSHELRTPLNSVLGFSQVLDAEYFGKLNEKQKEYVKDVLESGKHLLSLIDDILEIAQIETGKMELSVSNVDMEKLIDNVAILMRQKAADRSITLDVKKSPGLPKEITCDERKVKQVIFNFVSNAIKHVPEKGEIDIDARKISPEEIEISVTDNGPGIKKEDQSKLFMPFVKLDKTKAGTGLGLSLSKRMVGMWKGKIGVVSPPEGKEKGCRFYFTVPIQ